MQKVFPRSVSLKEGKADGLPLIKSLNIFFQLTILK